MTGLFPGHVHVWTKSGYCTIAPCTETQASLAGGGCAELLCSTAGLTRGDFVTVLDIVGEIVNVEDISHQIHTVMRGDLRAMSEDE